MAEVPPGIRTALQARKLAAGRACNHAARAAQCLQDEDPTIQANATGQAALTIQEWANATNSNTVGETLEVLKELIKVT